MPAINTTGDTPPTRRQLAYLKALAQRTGQTFAWPRTSAHASRQIRTLRAALDAGVASVSIAEERAARQANDDVPLTIAVHDFEVDGYLASATWSQRS